MNAIGLQRGIVILFPYQTTWVDEFESEKLKLQHVLGDRALDIQHVGSTAVPGLAAKPIVDIAIAVSTLEIVDRLIEPLQILGYEHKGEAGVRERRFFAKGPESNRSHYLHISALCTEFSRLLKFRDILKADPELASQYEFLNKEFSIGVCARSRLVRQRQK